MKLPAATPLFLLALALPMHPAVADDLVEREYAFDLADIDEVEFRGNVGSIRILPATGTQLQLELEIEAQERGWFRRQVDVSELELETRSIGSRLVLEQSEEHTKTTWTIRLPVVARTRIDLGVGEIDAELGATELDVDLGVGAVEVSLPAASMRAVSLSVGVGEARLRGLESRSDKRNMVSQDVRAEGYGNADVRIEVGVGEIDLTALQK